MATFLDDAPRHIFFTGKGGVGKTSVACATAVELAHCGKRVLLVSTDPASNVGHVFGQTIGNRITPIDAVPGLDALDIDPQQAAEDYRNRIIDPVRAILPPSEIAAITEQLSGSCTVEIASFNEFTNLLADPSRTADYDHVIFDTAPTGHTIRLLQLPGDWTAYLDDGKGDASCLGPMSGLDKAKSTYRAAVEALTDPEVTRLVLVARAQPSSLRETHRTLTELAEIGIQTSHLVINGLLPHADDADPLHRAIVERERAALETMPTSLATLQRDDITLKATTMIGVDALSHMFARDETDHRDDDADIHLPEQPGLDRLVDDLADQDHGLVMTMGKGGVGKTTIAAAIATELARRGKKVLLTTSDPATHLAATLAGEVAGLTVDSIDPDRATAAYRERVMAARGSSLDEEGRAALAEDLRSPCTEEIAVFQEFSHAVNMARQQFVIMDTAPTGHTLLLMDATGSYHRDVLRHMDSTQRLHATTPLMRLQDPEHTKIIVVTLPDTTPVLEATSLVTDLARADIHPWAWVINNSLAAARPSSALLKSRARHEVEQITTVTAQAPRWAVVATQADEPMGQTRLRALVSGSRKPS
ncbi:arsenical pump-driving ATPase [Cutibacterium equinum]|uniref:Arsenical pump-driving ATPase n=1 Tax=Cutibacterium equinum TaxID=3016342 RepID=A0ABY7QXL2_9ACTN|nr:arsenical pump-driving ATPase [Cutibacterium equinum]WCC79791.1 arsenical pump-driving ATPase [Cutibacterium equinum]